MVTQDEIDVRLVDAERLGLQKGEKLGLAKGEKLGMAKGEKLGMEKCMKSVARKMLAKGSPLSEIADITGLSEKEIRALKKS